MWDDVAVIERGQRMRQDMADEQNALVAAARNACGPAKTYGEWIIKDRTGILPDKKAYCCRREGVVGWHPSAEEAFGADTLCERRKKTVEVNGKAVPLRRWMLCHQYLEEYHPLSTEALVRRRKTMRSKQRKRAVERDMLRMPLFANQIESESCP